MTTTSLVLIAVDLCAVSLLVFLLFLPRHGRRELIVAYLGVNVGVLAVTAALAGSSIGAGLGLGLFGVLSIIRLRSEELSQQEVAYYFAALALGLLGGLGSDNPALIGALMALVLLAIAIGDHPKLARRSIRQELLVDRAFTDDVALRGHVEATLGEVRDLTVLKTDLVNDTTLIAVRRFPATSLRTSPRAVTARPTTRSGAADSEVVSR